MGNVAFGSGYVSLRPDASAELHRNGDPGTPAQKIASCKTRAPSSQRYHSARKPAAHALSSTLLPFGSLSSENNARAKNAYEIQRQCCLTTQPAAAGQAPNFPRVPIRFHDLIFSIFCYQQHDIVSNNILSNGSWESGTGLRVLETIAKACNKLGVTKEAAIFLDIGANIGWYLLQLQATQSYHLSQCKQMSVF